MEHRSQLTLGLVLTLFFANTLYAQEPYVYPAKGQSQKQMEKDKFDCYVWAKQESGFDPVNPPSQQELEAKASQRQQAQQNGGSEVGEGVVKGAIGGAIIGEVISDDPGKGAAIGGIYGGIRGAKREEQKQAQQQQTTQQQAQAELARQRDSYNRAYAACLEGRGYTVK